MKELLYKKSEAVAALNRVDGFHPMELARKIGEEGQEEQLYLDVKYRKLWFRLVNPAGKIISRIITFTENMAVVEARIYLDKCDQEDNYVANSFSQKFRSDDPKFWRQISGNGRNSSRRKGIIGCRIWCAVCGCGRGK